MLQGWIGEPTASDRERLRLWGISSKLLNVAEVEVSRHLLCAAVRFWKPAHHVFRFSKVELTPTLEKVHWICGSSKLLGPAVFMRCNGYASVLCQMTGLTTIECKQRLMYVDGSVPMLRLEYFDQVAWRRATLGDDMWLWSFIICFLGELIFCHGWMMVAIVVVEIALAVVTR